MKVLVVGAGVSGLSCALRIAQAGHAVEVLARELSPQTTSDVAAAIWYPYRAEPRDRVERWARTSFEVFVRLARDAPRSGVTMVEGVEVRADASAPWWRGSGPQVRPARPDELPPPYRHGLAFQVPVIEMPCYLPWLMEEAARAGVAVTRAEVRSLDELNGRAERIVNCAGLGARELVGDASLYPIRGQLLRCAPFGEDRFLLDEDERRGVRYIIPRSADCVIGGTAEVGEWSTAPDEAATAAILARAAGLSPRAADARVLEVKVGLRPGRATVRLEREGTVVHDYGHGGAGVTLSWGCADEVVSLLE